MKLLFVTQVVDRNDEALGAYHGWLIELAKRFETIEVICLYEGEHALPANVRVHSLGKERGIRSALVYAVRFLRHAWRLRSDYDAVFVHMNQEYVLAAGWLWKLLGKRMYLWRNHYAGTLLTDIAAAFCAKVFCTSMHSYTARYRKTVLMPVGVDLARFEGADATPRAPRSILFLSRIAPSKRPDMFIEALGLLIGKGISFVASIYGSSLPADAAYHDSLEGRVEALGLHDRVRFYPGVPNEKAAPVFRAHDIFVNCSPSGMFDKTLFEAIAAGCVVLAISDDFARMAGGGTAFTDAASLAERLTSMLEASDGEQDGIRKFQKDAAAMHALPLLAERLAAELESQHMLI
ncbi:MAG: glycosyltransferase family 4 protein [Patescibacteria group bacterium]